MMLWLFIAGTTVVFSLVLLGLKAWCKNREKEWRRRNQLIDRYARETEKPTVLPSLEDVEEETHESRGLPSSAVMDEEDEDG